MDRPGYIYIIRAETGHYKIGRSCNVPNRMKLFAVKLPFKIEIIHTFHCADMVDAERQLHLIFAQKQTNGEWFRLNKFDVQNLKNIDHVDEHGEFYKVDEDGIPWGMPELWHLLPSRVNIKYTEEELTALIYH